MLSTLSKNANSIQKPLQIKNKYFKIILAPYTEKIISADICKLLPLKKTRLRVKQRSFIINQRKLRSSSLANIIHSMDAFVIHHIFNLVYIINKRLKKLNVKFSINIYTIHDCAVCNDNSIVRSLFLQSYKELQKSNYLQNITGVTEKMKDDLGLPIIDKNTILNPFFIKNK